MALRSSVPFLILALAASCGPSGPAPMTMEAHMKDMGALITTAGSDCGAHKTSIQAAADLPAALALEGPHQTKMTTHIDKLSTSVTEMSHCTKDGKAPDTLVMAGTVAKMKAEEASHQTAMAGVADLMAAHTEEDRHQAAMGTHMTAMTTDYDKMMAAASGYTCNMAH